jgi:hypothetical protein
MIDSYEKIRKWRQKADEARALAKTAQTAFGREHLLRVVESYEIVADEAQARLLSKVMNTKRGTGAASVR